MQSIWQRLLQKRWASVPKMWLTGLVLALSLVVVATVALWHLRGETIDSQARELSLLSLALTDEIHRELRGMSAGLRAMQLELDEGSLPTIGTPAGRALRTRTELMAMVDTLSLVDRDGQLLAASNPSPAPDLASFSPRLQQLDPDARGEQPADGEEDRDRDEVQHRDPLVVLGEEPRGQPVGRPEIAPTDRAGLLAHWITLNRDNDERGRQRVNAPPPPARVT